ncbi:MAG: hypothetical protein GYA62_10165 [Bacteroidales bacterium]|nr:hypothetical protein [Bacteroidales bacterium]
MKNTTIYKIEGIDCPSCACMIELELENIGIKSECVYCDGLLKIEGKHDQKKILKIIENAGCSIEKDS